ncbi:MAG: hypothetical protein HRT57_12945, partial [Crocinitomicaceae bacterium]|nr:hypothetical protein [Crocinitomicaceae bacterium]
DETDKEVIGFVSTKGNYENKITKFHINMIEGEDYDFTLRYGMEHCNFLLKDSLLYIANYNNISSGSALQCYSLKSKKIIWTAKVLQINAGHSKYSNKVTLSLYKNKLLMEGEEWPLFTSF